jgi:hypothetical protein
MRWNIHGKHYWRSPERANDTPEFRQYGARISQGIELNGDEWCDAFVKLMGASWRYGVT